MSKYHYIAAGKELLYFLHNNSSKHVNSSLLKAKFKYVFSNMDKKYSYLIEKNNYDKSYEKINIYKCKLNKSFFQTYDFNNNIADIGYYAPNEDGKLQICDFRVTDDIFSDTITDEEIANGIVSFLENTKDDNNFSQIIDLHTRSIWKTKFIGKYNKDKN